MIELRQLLRNQSLHLNRKRVTESELDPSEAKYVKLHLSKFHTANTILGELGAIRVPLVLK